jgi:tetratricopeptide (TPR) repeat protein
VTSRAPLRLRAERTLPLGPLPLEEAVTLFRERAQAARPDGAYAGPEAAAICERLDCLPLAIELAAAQIRVLPSSQILEHLTQRLALLRAGARDLPARQQTMEDAIGWSYELLTEPQQRCFRALGVFVGGWTLETAQAVCWAEEARAPQETLLTLAALVDASLVQAEMAAGGAVRFRMLELMREYAVGRLRVAGEEEQCRRRHATYYAGLAESVVVFGPGQRADGGQLALELPNARAALAWAEERLDAATGLRLAGWSRLWQIRGQIGETVQWLERMLALDAQAREQGEPVAPLTLRVERLYGFARALLGQGQLGQAEAFATEAVRMAERIGDEHGMSHAWATLGQIAQASGHLEQATAALTESFTHAGLADQGDLRHRVLVQLAELARMRKDVVRATAYLQEALAGAHATGNTWDVAVITTLLGHLAHQQQRYVEARARYRESLVLFRAFGSPTYIAWCLESLAATLCAEERYVRATRLCAAASELRKQANTPLPPAEREAVERVIATTRAVLGEPVYAAEWAVGSALTQDAAVAEALLDEVTIRSAASG